MTPRSRTEPNQKSTKFLFASMKSRDTWSTGTTQEIRPNGCIPFKLGERVYQIDYTTSYGSVRLAKGFPEVFRHIANEAVNGQLRDAGSVEEVVARFVQ